MRILWLSMTPGLLHENEGTGNYGGSGWIGALQHLYMESYADNNTLGLVYLSQNDEGVVYKENVYYFPVIKKRESHVRKLLKYYGPNISHNISSYDDAVLKIIDGFKPDIIHLFGLENPFASILSRTGVPTVIHLQGLIGPCYNAYFPASINRSSFFWPPSKREWVFRNGFLYDNSVLKLRANIELNLFREGHYFMGRTDWDFSLSRLLSPESSYFHVGEALRTPFYSKKGAWRISGDKFIIVSTISETVYKGLDLILKTAHLLSSLLSPDFEWWVVGVNEKSNIVRFFERSLSIKGRENNVVYKGTFQADDLSELLLKASVYVHPSYIDNSPNSLCEAQILGLPVISTNVGGTSSLVRHQKSGLLIPSNGVYELAYWLVELNHNSDLALSLSKCGCEESSLRHDRKTIIDTVMSVYQRILDESS